MEQSACLHADETMAVCCPSVCDLWGVQRRIVLERLWHQMAFQKYTLKLFQPDPLAHSDPTPPLKLSFHYSSQRYNPASAWKEQCKYISFLPLFGFISASLTHGDSTLGFLDLLELQNVVTASNCWMSEFVQWRHLEPSALTKTQYSGEECEGLSACQRF